MLLWIFSCYILFCIKISSIIIFSFYILQVYNDYLVTEYNKLVKFMEQYNHIKVIEDLIYKKDNLQSENSELKHRINLLENYIKILEIKPKKSFLSIAKRLGC